MYEILVTIVILPFQFGRWSLLSVGVAYGAFHQNRLSKKETKFREIEAKEKVVKDAKLKEEKARAAAGKCNYSKKALLSSRTPCERVCLGKYYRLT